MNNNYAWDEYYASIENSNKKRVTKNKAPKITEAQIKENERVAKVWWSRISEEQRIKFADEEQWSTPDRLSDYQIRQIFCAVH